MLPAPIHAPADLDFDVVVINNVWKLVKHHCFKCPRDAVTARNGEVAGIGAGASRNVGGRVETGRGQPKRV